MVRGPATRSAGAARRGASEASADAGAIALRLDGVPRPLIVVDAPEEIAGIAAVTRGWTLRQEPAVAADFVQPAGRVARDAEGFSVASAFVGGAFRRLELASSVCAALADLAEARAEANPGVALLHAGAVETGGQVTAFIGRSRAGKSTLVARLGAEPDLRIYGDDMLPVAPDGTALALGIAPRIRLPLPEAASPLFRAHVADCIGICDGNYAFLAVPNLAPHGAQASLRTIFWLDRRRRGRARVTAVAPSEALERLRQSDMQVPADAGAHAARLATILAEVTCLELVYADLEEAVAAIRAVLDSKPAALAALAAPGRARPKRARPAPRDLALMRDPLAAPRPAGTGLWLVRRNAGGLVRLNAVGAAVWELLDGGATPAAIARDLSEVFPDVAPATIAADVARLLGEMLETGLVHPAEGRPAPRAR
jgi:hypothetical protein